MTRLALSALTSSLWGVASGGLSRFLDAALLLTFAGVRLISGVLQLTFPFGNSPVSCGPSGGSWEGAEVAEPPHTRTAATRPALGFANQGPATRVQRGPWADPASRLCSTSQENPTSTTAYFPGHHLRHAATDIPNREPAVASAFWLTRKLPSAAPAAALTGCLPR